MNKRFNIDWDNELTQEQLINLILTDEDLPKLRSLTIVIGRHNTPAIADFWQPYPFLNVNKKPRRVFISAGFLSVRALITLLSDHGSHGGDRFPSGDVYGYG